MITDNEEIKRVVKELKSLLGLPDEAYQSLTIHIKVGDVVRVEAEFIAKGEAK